MDTSKGYIIISMAALVLIGLFLFIKQKRKNEKVITSLTGLAYSFVLAGIIFGDERFIGYSLLGIGVVLSITDMIRNRK